MPSTTGLPPSRCHTRCIRCARASRSAWEAPSRGCAETELGDKQARSTRRFGNAKTETLTMADAAHAHGADAHAKPHHDYHLVDPSPWPIIGAVSVFLLA